MSLDSLYPRFANCGCNDEKYPHLWVKGASMLYDQLNSLLKYTDFKPDIINITEFESEDSQELGDLLNKHRSDKAIPGGHNYHLLYSYLLNKLGRDNELNVLEIGLGTNNPNLVSTMGAAANPGSSLYAWEEYLPNANIYGADIDRDILFNRGRIQTFYVDQLEPSTFLQMHEKINKKYDLIIDDGLHSTAAQLNTLLFGLEHIKDGGYIVIEDIWKRISDNWHIFHYILKNNKQFKTQIIDSNLATMFLVQKLPEST
jgi:hypothetical protein